MEEMYQYEEKLIREGIKVIAGVDEVGRGPLVGNVVAATRADATAIFLKFLLMFYPPHKYFIDLLYHN